MAKTQGISKDSKDAEVKESARSGSSDGKAKALGLAMDAIEKQYGKGSIMRLGESTHANVETVSTGALSLDIALGGGIPRGRIVEVYGPESSGKTTLTLHAIAEVQRNGGTAAFIDAEHALDPQYAKKLGVDVENMLISQPDSGEQALEIAETLVTSFMSGVDDEGDAPGGDGVLEAGDARRVDDRAHEARAIGRARPSTRLVGLPI